MSQHRDIAYANCKNCQMLFRRSEALRARNRLLVRQLQEERALRARAEQRVAELEQARRPTASNSSLPPSANPWGAKPPVKKKPTGRRPGGQIGHAGVSRKLLAVERMHRVVAHRPPLCRQCQRPLKASPQDRLIGRHQVAELPAVAVELTEHQSYACRCESCGSITRGRIPDEIAASSSGPRLTAAIGLLAGRVKGSKRDVAAVLGEVLGSPVALGSVAGREAELGQALEGP